MLPAANTPARLVSNGRGGPGNGHAPGGTSRPVRINPRSFSLTRSRSHCVLSSAPINYEDGRGGDLFTLAGPDVLERQGFQAGLAVAVGNSGCGAGLRRLGSPSAG